MCGGKFEALNRRPRSSDIENKGTINDEDLPSLELSLKRLRGVKGAGITIQDERNVLRRSDLSAFSRYNAASNTKKSPTGCAGSNSPQNNSLEVTMLAPPRVDTHKDLATQDFHRHYENHNCIPNNMKHQLQPDHDAESLKKMAAVAPHCGSSNVVEVLGEGNIGNCSVNRSTSGSNNGSNGQNGRSTAVNAGGTKVESNNGHAGNSGSGDASRSGSANRVDQNKSSHREAALTKFCQKRKQRKERCFHKKVRYQSRKILAEQRPRFRGQFVRQSSSENASEAMDN